MQTAKSQTNIVPGVLLVVSGAIIAALASHFQPSISDESEALGVILAIVLLGWGMATLLWQFQTTIFKLAGPLLIFAGLLILGVSWYCAAMLGVFVGGFLALVGAVLCLKK